MKLECPLTTQDETKQPLQNGHQRAENTNSSSQSKATKIIHKSPNGAKTKPPRSTRIGHETKTIRKDREKAEKQKSHKEILSVHIDDTQKSTYTAKVGSTEATALFDSGATLSCISK